MVWIRHTALSVALTAGLRIVCFSQTDVSGRIADKTQGPIPFANVLLTDSTGRTIIDFVSADSQARYRLSVSNAGSYTITFSALGYAEKSVSVTIESNRSELVVNAELEEKALELNEVIVEGRIPITIKKDTVVFDAQSFAEGNEEVVEDLLKKIPGLSVDDEGNIRVGNKEVEKVMVEGDDFFEKGYKLLTKNMPAQPIDQVELLQSYSENRLLKEVEKSEKVALNLKLKEDAKNQWFANIKAGYATTNRHTVVGNVSNFSKKTKYYFLTNLNTIGNDATGDIDHLINPYRPNDQTVIEGADAGQLIDMTTVELNFKKERTNFNNDKLVSTNAIFNPSPQVKITSLAFFNRNDRSFRSNSIEHFNAASANFTNTEQTNWDDLNFNGFGKIELTYDRKPNQIIESTTTINKSKNETLNQLTFNGSPTIEDLDTKSTFIDQQIGITTKIQERSVILLKGRFTSEQKPQHYRMNQFFFSDLFPEINNAGRLRQLSEAGVQFGGIEAHLIKAIGKNDRVDVRIGDQVRKDRLNTSLSILDQAGGFIVRPEGYQNDINYLTNDTYLNWKYFKTMGKKTLTADLDAHQLYNRIGDPENTESQNPFFINPSLSLGWAPGQKHKLSGTFSYNTTNADILDVYDNWALTGFRSFTKNTGVFNQLNASTAMGNYQYGSWNDSFFVNALVIYSKSHDFFAGNSVIQQRSSQTERVLFKDRDILSVSGNVDRFINVIASNLKVSLTYSGTDYKNVVNGVMRNVDSQSRSLGIELRSAFAGPFNCHIGSQWISQVVTTSIENQFTNHVAFLDLLFKISNKSTFEVQSERYLFDDTGTDDAYYFLDVEWKYSIKPNKFAISFSGNNLLNTNQFTVASITDISAVTTEYNLLPRYVLLKAEYRF